VAVHTPAGSDFGPYFDLVASVLDQYGGRPHWGKLHTLGVEELRGRYPRFEEFVAIRDRLDPAGVFTNRYLDGVLGPPREGG
jgi:L-gulonolactone oxidase